MKLFYCKKSNNSRDITNYKYFTIMLNNMTLRNIFLSNTEGMSSDRYYDFLLDKVIRILSDNPHYIKVNREDIELVDILRRNNTITCMDFTIRNTNNTTLKIMEDVYVPPKRTQVGVEPTIYEL